MREFIINQYIKLRLENDKTIIYVKNERFLQCKYLLLNIVKDNLESVSNIESIDEAAEKLNHSLESTTQIVYRIDPETEFWGHCSNLQVWVENNYDTRLLHSNLSFPLLKRLANAGDSKAKLMLKEEIARRLSSGYPSVVNFLYNNKFTDLLSPEEIFHSILNTEEAFAMEDIAEKLNSKFIPISGLKALNFLGEKPSHLTVKNSSVVEIELTLNKKNPCIPETISKLKNLKVLYICIDESTNKFTLEPAFKLSSLEELQLISWGNVEFPDVFNNFPNLKRLIIFGHMKSSFLSIPNTICDLKRLEYLRISSASLMQLPNTIGNLKSLRVLDLSGNPIKNLPKSIMKLKGIRVLRVNPNCLTDQINSWIKSIELIEIARYTNLVVFRDRDWYENLTFF